MKARVIFDIDIEKTEGLPVHSIDDVLASRIIRRQEEQERAELAERLAKIYKVHYKIDSKKLKSLVSEGKAEKNYLDIKKDEYME
jgi:hypothetical protein